MFGGVWPVVQIKMTMQTMAMTGAKESDDGSIPVSLSLASS